MTVKEDDLEAEIKFTHTLLDTFKVPRENSTGATFPLVGRVRHALELKAGENDHAMQVAIDALQFYAEHDGDGDCALNALETIRGK